MSAELVLIIMFAWLGVVAFTLVLLSVASRADDLAGRDDAEGYGLATAELERTLLGAPGHGRRVLAIGAGVVVAAIATVAAYMALGLEAVAVIAIMLVTFVLLLRGIRRSATRQVELRERIEVLGEHHEGLLGLMVEISTLRDPAASRHAAAVAHLGRELALAAGMSEHEQEIVHTAGLLHDVGQLAFPDAVIRAGGHVAPAARGAIESHPEEGARLLRRVPGLAEVAEAVEAHHERIDGTGYPHGLAADEIPRTARVVAIAEVYDALSAPESYRGPMHSTAVEAELRRVAGQQLDAELVEVFLEAVASRAHPRPSLAEELRVARRSRMLFA
jgi:putative nucleotidyltransferase with HDIG domain